MSLKTNRERLVMTAVQGTVSPANQWAPFEVGANGEVFSWPSTGGITYTWPVPDPGYPDNAIASGQQVTTSAPSGTQQAGFLGSATNRPRHGLVTLDYGDGSKARYWLGLSARPPGPRAMISPSSSPNSNLVSAMMISRPAARSRPRR